MAYKARDGRERRTGWLLAGGASLAAVLVLKVVVPGFAQDGRYLYAGQVGGGYGFLDGWPVKALTVLALLAVTGGLVAVHLIGGRPRASDRRDVVQSGT
ncbi:hypothetical protein ACWEP8_33410 [Streptomyces hydrogenans]